MLEVFWVFLRLGLTSFGGPVAHIGFFQTEFVTRRKWLDAGAYGEIVALCQFLPGPASSQVGFSIGLLRAGLPGAVAAWAGFTLPSAALLIALAYGLQIGDTVLTSGLLLGLKVAVVAVVAQALLGMAGSLATGPIRGTVALGAAAFALVAPGLFGLSVATAQLWTIVGGALAGLALLRAAPGEGASIPAMRIGTGFGAVCLGLFFLGLFGLPLFVEAAGRPNVLDFAEGFYRSGALVFGGGHVVLPLLEAEVVPTGWVERDLFLAGYGAAQAVPGPLFTFAAYLGAVADLGPGTPAPWVLGLVALGAIFLPAVLLVLGVLPFWAKFREIQWMRGVLAGVNAAVVGILGAAFYTVVFSAAIRSEIALAAALAAFAALVYWRIPAWAVVIAAGAIGAVAAG
jgi:chromate transporter